MWLCSNMKCFIHFCSQTHTYSDMFAELLLTLAMWKLPQEFAGDIRLTSNDYGYIVLDLISCMQW